MTTTLSDVALMLYFCTSGKILHLEGVTPLPEWVKVWAIISHIIPFWFRFWQCIRKYVVNKNKPQIFNAMKYFSKIMPGVIAIWAEKKVGGNYFPIYFGFEAFATTYCMVWDYYMDWGLFRSSERGTFMLREKISFAPSFYYFAMILNAFLRFFWLWTIFEYDFEYDPESVLKQIEILVVARIFAEALRRTVWAIIRVENEMFNNFEQYRSIPQIPSLLSRIGRIDKQELNLLRKNY